MGALFDYFSADSDESAASAVSLPDGPGDMPFDTVHTKGVDPLVQLGTLEALLTARDYAQIVTGPRAGRPLAAQGSGERLVVTLTDELQAALADADEALLASVAEPWARAEEFSGHGDSQLLAGLLHGLAELARRARAKNERMYCWLSV
jgi:hypothetical protein